MARVLVTGRNSFIGQNFRNFSSHEVVAEVSVKNIDPESVDFANCDVVLHLAAIVHQSHKNSEDYFRVNRDLTLSLAKAAKMAQVKQFVFMSTVKVYGKYASGSKTWTEESQCFPDEPYGKSKYQAELELKKLETPDFIISIIRTPIVYGEGVSANILKLIKLVDTVPFLPFKNVNNNRHYTSAENLIGFIDRIIQLRTSGIFIAMDGQGISTSELVTKISYYLNRKVTLFGVPVFLIKFGVIVMPSIFDRLYNSFYLDNSNTLKMLDYSPPFSTDMGLEKVIRSYLNEKSEN